MLACHDGYSNPNILDLCLGLAFLTKKVTELLGLILAFGYCDA